MAMPDGSPDYPDIAAQIGLDRLRLEFTALTGAGVTVGQVEGSASGAVGAAAIDTEADPSAEGHLATNSDHFFTYINGAFRSSVFDDGVIGTRSSHAAVVGSFFYDAAIYQGAPTGVAPGVAHVDNYNAENYLLNLQGSYPDKVVNLSFLYTDATHDAAFDAAANKNNTVFVAAAGNGGTPGSPSTAYNVISVDTSTLPQAIGPAANGAGKPDISAPQVVTSRAAPIVAGAATLLVQAGAAGWAGSTAANRTDAVDFREIKALLLNGAVKPADYYTTAYAPTAGQPLNAVYGAGVVNIYNAVTTLYAGEFAASSTGSVSLGAAHFVKAGAAVLAANQGWNLATLATPAGKDAVDDYVFSLAAGSSFTATLTWAADNQNHIDGLGLYLFDDATGQLLASSDAAASNVQQVNFTPSASGTYDLQVLLHGAAGTPVSEKYALAFSAGIAVACFCAGSRILTPGGEIPIEQLRVGDRVVTAAGRIAPIRFIGQRRVAAAIAIRLCRDAFGEGAPLRDLLLSPEHAVALRDDQGQVLIPVHRLLNGVSIAEQSPAECRYFHLELDRHDILLAEGLPVESYLDTGNRAGFGEAVALFVDPAAETAAALRIWAERGAAPLLLTGPRLATLHQRLLDRAAPAVTTDPALQVEAAGQPLHPLAATSGHAEFLLPANTAVIRIRTRAANPRHLQPDAPDQRRLGLAVCALKLADTPISLRAGPACRSGWHPPEGPAAAGWRWTDGDATLALPPCASAAVLAIDWLPGLANYLVAALPAPSSANRAAAIRFASTA